MINKEKQNKLAHQMSNCFQRNKANQSPYLPADHLAPHLNLSYQLLVFSTYLPLAKAERGATKEGTRPWLVCSQGQLKDHEVKR